MSDNNCPQTPDEAQHWIDLRAANEHITELEAENKRLNALLDEIEWYATHDIYSKRETIVDEIWGDIVRDILAKRKEAASSGAFGEGGRNE